MANRTIYSGDPGTTWTNDTGRVQYQFVASLINTCGICLQYHLKIGAFWPIPIHWGCRCQQRAIGPDAKAPHPFRDYRAVLDAMPHDQQVKVIGSSNLKLLRAGVIKWEDVVTPTRIRDLRDVVHRLDLRVDQLTAAGIRPYIAREAHAAVHAAAHEEAERERRRLIDRLERAGLDQDRLIRELSRGLAERASVAAGAGSVPKAGEQLGPAWGSQRLAVDPGHADELARALDAWRPGARATPKPEPKPKPVPSPIPASPRAATAPPIPIDAFGSIDPAEIEEISRCLHELPRPVLDALNRHGVRVAFADRVRDFSPKQADEPARGHGDSRTLGHAGAYYDPAAKVIVLAKRRKRGQAYVPLGNRFGVLRHEVGHAFDAASGHLSHGPEFAKAYNRDVGKLGRQQRSAADYFLQAGHAGAEEAFAEVFADLLKGGARADVSAADFFEESAELIAKWAGR